MNEPIGDRRLLKKATPSKKKSVRVQQEPLYPPNGILLSKDNKRYQACKLGKTLRRIL